MRDDLLCVKMTLIALHVCVCEIVCVLRVKQVCVKGRKRLEEGSKAVDYYYACVGSIYVF